MKRFLRTMLVVAASTLLFAACNSDYNFDKISLEVTVGDTEGITIPIGTTEKITINSLLGTESGLTPDKDGFYSISMSDAIEEKISVGKIDPITNLAPTIEPSTIALMGEMGAVIPKINETQTVPYPNGLSSGFTIPSYLVGQPLEMVDSDVFEERYDISLPDHIKSIDHINFGTKGEGSLVSITFNIAGLLPVTENRVLKYFAIEAPAGFELKKVSGDPLDGYATISKGEGSSTNNHYEVDNLPLNDSKVVLQFLLMSANFEGSAISDGHFFVNDDIKYSYDLSCTLKAGTTGTEMPYVEAVADIAISSADVTLEAWAQNFTFAKELNHSVTIPEVVKEISYIEISRTDLATAIPQLDVALDLSGSPLEEITLSELKLALPTAVLDFDTPQGWTLDGNYLKTSNLKLRNGTNQIITLPLNGIKSIPIVDGKASIGGNIGVEATIAIAEGESLSIDTSAKDIVIAPKVAIDDLAIHSLVGIIDPDLSSMLEPVEVDLSELTSALGDNLEVELNLASPTLNFSVQNPIGVGIDLVVKIDAWKNGAVSKSVSTPTLKIAGAEGSTPTTTNISLTGDTPAEGQTQVEGLMDVINSLPDKLVVTLNATTDTSKPHTLIVKESYDFKVDYSVDAALKFDQNKSGRLSYTTVIEDIDLSEVGEVNLAIDSLTVNVMAQSTLPLDALLKIKFLDEEKKELSQIKTLTTGKILGSKSSDQPATSQISIGVGFDAGQESSVAIGALLGSVRAVECTVEGTTLAGAGLKPDQWLQATLSLCLDKGITIDLGTLAGSGEGEGEGEGKKE
ncbi:MAG: hypothetical protein IKB18_02575 [Tidjanibacter sp.]|nr:hypothetical protein [Tidjanibacter sp.]